MIKEVGDYLQNPFFLYFIILENVLVKLVVYFENVLLFIGLWKKGFNQTTSMLGCFIWP